MLTSNPFAELSALIPPTVMQVYVVIMIILVAGGTLFDILHKKSAKYFFNNWRKAKNSGARQVGGGEAVSLAVRTVVVEGLMSGEFCNARRRIAHLLTMYGFLAYVITTAVMVFWYATPEAPGPAILPLLWWIGGLLICIGGYWFWFFIRVDVVAEGNSPFRVVRADLFILSLLASATLGLIWARRCSSDLSRGQNSHICSSSLQPPYRNGWQRQTVQEATYRHLPINPKFSAVPAERLDIIKQPIVGLRYRR